MNVTFETLLVLGIAGFYIFDSARLLYVNEIVFFETAGTWDFHLPNGRWQVLGKNIFIPNPLTPYKSMYLTSWPQSNAGQASNLDGLNSTSNELTPLRYLTVLLFMLLITGTPAILFRMGLGWTLITLLSLIYITVGIMVWVLIKRRSKFNLSKSDVGKLAFDAIACVPFALNLIRKITAKQRVSGDPIIFAKSVLSGDKFELLINVLLTRIDDELAFELNGCPRYLMLSEYRKYIESY